MKPAVFDYVRAESLEEALEALHQEGDDARVLAGGQTLIPMLNMRMARPSLVIDIMRISGLDQIESVDTAIRVGATVRQCALEQDRELSVRQPLLAAAVPWIGHAQTRSRGTVCGSVAHADPSAELPLVLVALNGEIELRSRRRSRRLSAEHFYTGVMTTACEPDEMIEAVRFPIARAGTGYAFREVGRRHGDFAIAACAAVVGQRTARLAVGGVADRPTARDLPPPEDRTFGETLEAFAADLQAHDDMHATAEYRRHLVRCLGRRTIEEAAQWRG
jgi:2-furoyl-CoA dehydrogenase FAD binding subunit